MEYICRGNCFIQEVSFLQRKDITEKDIHGKYENGILMLDIPKKAPEKKVEEKKFVTIEG